MNWSIVRGNDELNLSDRSPFDLISATGVGLAPVRRLTERGPFQDGDSDVGFRLDARTINLVVASISADRSGADEARDALWSFLRPTTAPVKLRCIRDDGTVRQIDAVAAGVVDAPVDAENRIGAFQRFAVQLRAPSPIWYSTTGSSFAMVGGTSTGAAGFRVPTDVPTAMVPVTTIDVARPLAYPGTWAEYPKLIIYGPGTGFVIENETTGDVLELSALALGVGEYLEIDLAYGAKTVVDDTGANRIDELTTDSDLATWRLAAAPEATGGTNSIRFAVDADASEATGLKVEYTARYVAL